MIGPAISTLEDLQGAWESMSAKMKTLISLFEDETKDVPPMDMAETDLQSIIEEWNYLRDDGMFLLSFFSFFTYIVICYHCKIWCR